MSTESPAQISWAQFREQMPVAERYAYFDHAAVSPLPRPAADAIQLWLDQSLTAGDAHWPAWAARVEKARRVAAAGMNAEPEEIAFVGSTTEGVTFVAEGIDWRDGDHVVLLDNEFPSNVYPWLNLASRGVETIQVPAGDRPTPATLLDACSPKTRLISISWVSFSTGWRFDIESLVEEAQRRGILVFLDAIQGLGVFPLDLKSLPIDFLAADGHKWMMGPEGAGLLFVRRDRLTQLRPLKVGWNSVVHAYDFSRIEMNLKDEARRYEGGSQNMVGVHALGASLQHLSDFGWGPAQSAVGQRVLEISELACDRLRSIGAEIHSVRDDSARNSGIVSFSLPGREPQPLRDRAFDDDVVLSCRNGRLRIAPHAYNNEHDIARLIDSLTAE